MDKELFIQITGKSCIGELLKKDKDYSVNFKRVGVYGIDERSGEGDMDKITFKCRNLDEVIIVNEESFVVGKPKKNSQSQVLRRIIGQVWEQQIAGEQEKEPYYQQRMSEIIEQEKEKLI